jgi:hypothetical protein
LQFNVAFEAGFCNIFNTAAGRDVSSSISLIAIVERILSAFSPLNDSFWKFGVFHRAHMAQLKFSSVSIEMEGNRRRKLLNPNEITLNIYAHIVGWARAILKARNRLR